MHQVTASEIHVCPAVNRLKNVACPSSRRIYHFTTPLPKPNFDGFNYYFCRAQILYGSGSCSNAFCSSEAVFRILALKRALRQAALNLIVFNIVAVLSTLVAKIAHR
jgi:hypothetical protein